MKHPDQNANRHESYQKIAYVAIRAQGETISTLLGLSYNTFLKCKPTKIIILSRVVSINGPRIDIVWQFGLLIFFSWYFYLLSL